jgi:protein TonB
VATDVPDEAPVTATLPDPVHYAAKDLDVYPQPLNRVAPAYPDTARESQVAGFVTLLVSIDETGRVTDASVVDAIPDGVFELAAQQALAHATFYPAQKNGHAVRSRILIKVEFDPAPENAAR